MGGSTTVKVDGTLWEALKVRAVRERTTLQVQVERGLRAYVGNGTGQGSAGAAGVAGGSGQPRPERASVSSPRREGGGGSSLGVGNPARGAGRSADEPWESGAVRELSYDRSTSQERRGRWGF
jgi:hypothetical protein